MEHTMFRSVFNHRHLLPLAILSLLLGCSASDEDAGQNNAQAPSKVAVEILTLQTESVLLKTQLPARTAAIRIAEVRPQVNGIIEQRLFTEGTTVKAGEQLYQIEPDRYQADVANARANLQRAEADLKVSTSREQRFKTLVADNAISRQEYDEALATFEQAKAQIAVSKAALDMALINLRYTQVNAPIDGQIGVSHVTEGALVSAGQTNSMATIHQLDPIYVDISQASKDMLKLRRQLIEGKLNGEDAPIVRLTLEDGSVYTHEGELQFSEVSVNQNTGSVLMRARFPNPDTLLLPGMYVRAEIREGRLKDAILVPQKAVTFGREGDASVFVVNADNVVEKRTIVIPRSVGNRWLVESGLAADERIVTVGLQKIAEGTEVEIVESEPATEAEG
jgi:membrane fusion protein (multidrug efflux system)